MDSEYLHGVALTLSSQRTVAEVVDTIVEALAGQDGIALARIWLIEQGSPCGDDAPAENVLRLSASDGRPLNGERVRSLEGEYATFMVGERKIGRIAATGKPIFLANLDDSAEWVKDPIWASEKRIKSFAGQPLVFRGETLGVLAVFSRELLCENTQHILQTFADHAAAAYANARAFEEIDCLRTQLEMENEYLRDEVMEVHAHGEILGESSAVMKLLQQIELVAPTESTVLIEGESGTGKELIARAIHGRSTRSARPMIKVNCASVSKDLFESEFFGHVRGAFTGAIRDRAGRFALADGGTLFLDEVGEIPIELQGKLLRVIQEGEYERVGDESTRSANVRIIAATNRDLEEEVRRGTFRQDLYYRLSVFPIASPPLRARAEDIPILAQHFLTKTAAELGIPIPVLKQRHVLELQAYAWPGNIRELQNAMERATITATQGSLAIELGNGRSQRAAPSSRPVSKSSDDVLSYPELKDVERANLERALAQTSWKIGGPGGAAELLETAPTTLASRIKKFGLVRPRS